MDERIFGAEFAQHLELLRIAARRLIREGRWRLLRERRRGRGQEFSDHRDYVPGDDIRHIDWYAFARLDRAKVKIFEENEAPPLTILLDRSASMEGAVLRHARQVAAGLAHVGLSEFREVTIVSFSAGRQITVGPFRGLGSYPEVIRFLEVLRAVGQTRLSPSIRRAAAGRRGVAVLLSDLLEAEGWEVSMHRRRGHRLILVHWEAEVPACNGASVLRDRETGEVIRRTLSPQGRASHRRVAEAASRRIEREARQAAAGYLRASPEIPFDRIVLEILKEITCGTPWS